MLSPIADSLGEREISCLDQRARSPYTRYLDAVNGRAEELVIRLDDAETAADEDELLWPFGLVAEDLADCGARGVLHFVLPGAEFGLREAG